MLAKTRFFPTGSFNPGDATNIKFQGEVKDPSFGMDAIWIERHQEVEAEQWLVCRTGVGSGTYVSQVMYKFAHELIGQDDVQD